MHDIDVDILAIDALPQERGDRFAARTGFDPRARHAVPLVPHLPAPHPGQAWREVNELQMETR